MNRIVVAISDLALICGCVLEVYLRHQTDDPTLEISRTKVVINKRMPELSKAIGCVFLDPVRQAILRVLPIVDHRATPVAAGIVNIGFDYPRIELVIYCSVVLRPRSRGPLLAHPAGPHLTLHRQTLLPAGAVIL